MRAHSVALACFAARPLGEYVDGKRHGQGTFTGVDGSSYQGSYAHDVKEGEGEYTYADGGT